MNGSILGPFNFMVCIQIMIQSFITTVHYFITSSIYFKPGNSGNCKLSIVLMVMINLNKRLSSIQSKYTYNNLACIACSMPTTTPGVSGKLPFKSAAISATWWRYNYWTSQISSQFSLEARGGVCLYVWLFVCIVSHPVSCERDREFLEARQENYFTICETADRYASFPLNTATRKLRNISQSKIFCKHFNMIHTQEHRSHFLFSDRPCLNVVFIEHQVKVRTWFVTKNVELIN